MYDWLHSLVCISYERAASFLRLHSIGDLYDCIIVLSSYTVCQRHCTILVLASLSFVYVDFFLSSRQAVVQICPEEQTSA